MSPSLMITEWGGLSKQHSAHYKATHESKGIGLAQARLELDKLLNERQDIIEIIDKKDRRDNSLDTKVILTVKEK